MATETQTAFILTEVRDHVGIITFNRPERLNALHAGMMSEFVAAVHRYNDDPAIGAIVLTGAGRAFCAGADIKGWNAEIEEGQAGQRMAARRTADDESLTEMWQRSKPAVIAINGFAIGAGLTMTLGADYRIASETAKVSMRFAAMGVLPELQSTRLLAQLVGQQHANDLMLTGAIVDAQHALRVGLVAEVVPPEALLERAVAKASEYARIAPEVTRTIKRVIADNQFEPDAKKVKERERVAFAELQQGPAHTEAVKAFVEKREPDFYAGR